MTSQLVWTSNTGDAKVDHEGHPWYDGESTQSLIDLHAKLRVQFADPHYYRCDNFAPGTCCDDCNYNIIANEIAWRLRLPVGSLSDRINEGIDTGMWDDCGS